MFHIAERFYSLQGEGSWVGMPMYFVRLAQCPVGGPEGICHSWDNREFLCDTGRAWGLRRRKDDGPEWHSYDQDREQMTAIRLMDHFHTSGARHLCVTGGEPMIYPLEELLDLLNENEMLHIETSGTVFSKVMMSGRRRYLWVTLSPKKNWRELMLAGCDEVKLLVHDRTTDDDIVFWKKTATTKPLFLQAIDEPDSTALNKAIELCKKHNLRLSLQTHKYTNIR